MQQIHPLLQLPRTHLKASFLTVPAEVVEEAVWELLSAEDQDVLIVGLWPSCWKRNARGLVLGSQWIRDGKSFLRLETSYQH